MHPTENDPSLEQLKANCERDPVASCAQLGARLLKMANTFEAEKALKRSCDGGSPVGCTLLGIQYETASNFDAAEFLYKSGCKATEDRPSGCLQLMNLAIRRNRLIGASDWLASSCSLGIPAACEAYGVSRLRLNKLDGNRVLAEACSKGSNEACLTHWKVLPPLAALFVLALLFASLCAWLSVRKGAGTPGVLQGVGLSISVTAIQLAGIVFMSTVPGLRNASEGLIALTSISLGWFSLIGFVFYLGKKPFQSAFMFKPFRPILLPAFASLSVGLSIAVSEGNNIIQHWIELPDLLPMGLFSGESENWGLIWLCLVAPVCEEVFFRGFLFQGLRSRYGWTAGAILSAILFSVFHANPAQFFPALVLGFGYAWVVQKAGSIWPTILLHALNNSTVAFSAALGISIQGFNAQQDTSPTFHPLWFDALGLLLLIVGIGVINRFGEIPVDGSRGLVPANLETPRDDSKAA